MTTDLRAAVAHIKRITPPTAPWNTSDLGGGRGPVLTDSAIATILNAVVSGDLVLKADVDGLVEALAFTVKNSRIYGVTPDSKGAQVWHDNAVGSVARAALTALEKQNV